MRGRGHSAGFEISAATVGFALSAFFDGILLHQVLQWHHLLSLARGATWRDLHNQILADGVFHLVVYLVLILGLALLWRRRGELAWPGASRRVWADALIGFGLWNVVDVVGFHWIVGLHRVRVDVADPLPWDIGWLAALGFAPMVVGGLLRRGGRGLGGGPAAAGLASLALVLGLGALRPAGGGGAVFVGFAPQVAPERAFAAVVGAGGLVTDVSPSGRSMIARFPDRRGRWRLYLQGAWAVGGAGPAGCGVFAP